MTRMYGTPRVILYDLGGNVLIDTVAPNIALSSFNYQFEEKDADICTIILKLTDVDQFNFYAFKRHHRIRVAWGYIGFMTKPISIIIDQVRRSYTPSGYTLTITATDNLAALQGRQDSQAVVYAKDLKAAMQNIQDLGLALVAVRENQKGNSEFYYPLTGYKYYCADVLSDLPGTFFHGNTSEMDHYRVLANGQKTLNKGRDGAYADGADLTNDGKYERTDPNDPEYLARFGVYLNSQRIAAGEEEPYKWFGIDENAKVSGNNPADIIKKSLDASGKSWNMTGHGETVVIHSHKITSTPYRKYNFRNEDGFFLEFEYDSENKYEEETALTKFTIDPESGALTVKSFLNDRLSKKVVEVYDPWAHDQALSEQRALNELAKGTEEVKGSVFAGESQDVYDDKGVFRHGFFIDRPYTTSTPSAYLPTGLGTFLPAIDNTAVTLQAKVLIAPLVEELEEAAEEIITEARKGEGEVSKNRIVAKVVGDPLLCCTTVVELKGLSKYDNGSYHITSCSHVIDQGGYVNVIKAFPLGAIGDGVGVGTISSGKVDVKTKTAKDITDPGGADPYQNTEEWKQKYQENGEFSLGKWLDSSKYKVKRGGTHDDGSANTVTPNRYTTFSTWGTLPTNKVEVNQKYEVNKAEDPQ